MASSLDTFGEALDAGDTKRCPRWSCFKLGFVGLGRVVTAAERIFLHMFTHFLGYKFDGAYLASFTHQEYEATLLGTNTPSNIGMTYVEKRDGETPAASAYTNAGEGRIRQVLADWR